VTFPFWFGAVVEDTVAQGGGGLSPPERADAEAQSANGSIRIFCPHHVEIAIASAGVEPDRSRILRSKRPAGKGPDRADGDAFPAVTATLGHGLAGRDQGGIRQQCRPPHPGAHVRGDQQAVFADPSQAGQVRAQLMREDGAKPLVVDPFRGGNGEGAAAAALDDTGEAGDDLVEPGIDDVVAVGEIADGSRSCDSPGKLVDDWMEETYADRDGSRVHADWRAALFVDRVMGRGQIGYPEIIGPEGHGRFVQVTVEVHPVRILLGRGRQYLISLLIFCVPSWPIR